MVWNLLKAILWHLFPGTDCSATLIQQIHLRLCSSCPYRSQHGQVALKTQSTGSLTASEQLACQDLLRALHTDGSLKIMVRN